MANTDWIITPRFDAKLYGQIYWGMRYWEARLMRGWNSTDAAAYANRNSPLYERLRQVAKWRTRYRRLRAAGYSWAEARGQIAGWSPRVVTEKSRLAAQRYRRKMGGRLTGYLEREKKRLEQKYAD